MILYRYIIREHIVPFFSALAIIVFLFVMQQVVLLLDKIISKGLDPAIVLEVFAIQLAWIVTLAIPMAILVATLTTFGRMAGDNEITSIKASGQNLGPLLTPVFVTAAVLGVLNVYFNDLILPDANHRVANLLSDISRKKPTAFIEPKVLIRDFTGYTIYTEGVNNKTGGLSHIRIFTDASGGQDPSLTVADSADLRITPDQKYLEFTLYDGETHSISRKNKDEYFLGRFEKQIIAIENVDDRLQRRDSDIRGDREKCIAMMLDDVKDYKKSNANLMQEYHALIETLIVQVQEFDSLSALRADSLTDSLAGNDTLTFREWVLSVNAVDNQRSLAIRPFGDLVSRLKRRLQANNKMIAKYMVEVHKKYSIPSACVLYVLIGAPLGIMARSGGMAVGAAYSMFFFIVSWAGLIGGERMADKMKIPPWVGMWGANIFIAVCGIVIMVLMMRETTIRFDFIVTWWKSLTRKINPRKRFKVIVMIVKLLSGIFWIPRWILRKLFGTLPIYLIGIFSGWAVLLTFLMLAVFVVIDYVSNLRRFDGAPYQNVLLYYWFYLPWIIQVISPIVLLLASMFSIGKMAKNSELTAMKASGISLRQLTFPLLFLGILLSVGSFYGGEYFLPRANLSRRHLLDNLRDPDVSSIGRVSGLREFRRHFYYFGNPNTMYVYDEFSTAPQRARGVARERFRRNRVVERISAKEMLHDSTGWRFVNGTIRSFSETGATLTSFDTLADSILTVKPVEMVAKIKGKQEMSYWELRGFIEAAKKRGEKVQKYMGELDFKLALPFVNFIVVLLGIAITARSGRKGGAVFFGIGLGLVLAFLIMARLAIVFAQNGYIPTLVGAWITNIFFLLLGLILYKRAIW